MANPTETTMELEQHAKALGIQFTTIELLREALTHRSYINEHRGVAGRHNERLEFLGDAVLELATTHFLFSKFPEKAEGDLTAYRSALVNTFSLAEVAGELGVSDMLLLSRGEARDMGRARLILIANAFEAIIGAIYLDQGFAAAEAFIARTLYPKLDTVLAKRTWQDSKSRFQEAAQEKRGITPIYKTLFETGPDHDKKFTVGVFVGEEEIARGEGKAKQEAEQEAARIALEKSGW